MISVVVPTYGHRDTVLETLDSVFAQTEPPGEVIVVNDGSPDDTAELLRPLADRGRIRYVEQANGGQARARNRGLALARGDHVALLDDDDIWPEDKLAWQREFLDSDPGAVLVYGSWTRLGATPRPGGPEAEPQPDGDVYDAFLRGCRILSPGQTLIRRSALAAAGGFDPRVWGADDWDLYLRLARLGRFRYRPRVALRYRKHEGNASRAALRHADHHFRVMRRHLGLNLPAAAANLHGSARFFVPHLLAEADAALESGDPARALRATAYAAAFRPALLLRRRLYAPLLRALRK